MAKPTTLIDFGTSTVRSTPDFIRENINLELREVETEQGIREEPCLVFRTNAGKGSGAQVWRLSEMESNLETLEQIHRQGYEQAVNEAGYTPGPAVIRKTVSVVDEEQDDGESIRTVKFRATEGKGSKPASVPLDQMADSLSVLREYVEKGAAWGRANGYLDAPEAAEAAEAAPEADED